MPENILFSMLCYRQYFLQKIVRSMLGVIANGNMKSEYQRTMKGEKGEIPCHERGEREKRSSGKMKRIFKT